MSDVVDGGDIRIIGLELGPYQTNCYIIVCKASGKSLLIDAPAESETILKHLEDTNPVCIAITHNHIDHIDALLDVRTKLHIPVAVHPLDAPGLPCPAEIRLQDGDTLDVGPLKIKVMHTPGHTPGSICLSTGKYLLAGDTIFPGGPGHTSTPSDFRQIVQSIESRILPLPDNTVIYPGHGGPAILSAERGAISAFLSRPHPAEISGDVLWSS
jgi:hydroxyacylglutathione hydrolase